MVYVSMAQSILTSFSAKKLPFLKKFISVLPQKAEVYVVGGAVRDALLRRQTKDIDVLIRNVPAKQLETSLRKLGPVELVGKSFGVFKWRPMGWSGEHIDVALPRRDHAFGTGGYKDVTTQSDPKLPLAEDMLRRDFTVNALAFDVKKKKVIDTVGGLDDIKAKILRSVGDPVKRFHEDYLRILRGLRLSITLDFSVDGRCAKVMRIMMHHLMEQTKAGEWVVPRETIGRELVRMYVANPLRAFDECFYSGFFASVIPEVMDLQGCPQPKQFHAEGDVMQHTRKALSLLSSEFFKKKFPKAKVSAELAFAVLLHDIGKPKTITYPESESKDRIRYNNHDAVGAHIATEVARRLSLSVFPKNDFVHRVDPEHLGWIVKHHLVGFRNQIRLMRPSTVEKYFFHEHFPSQELLQLQCVDSAATVGPKGKPDMSGWNAIMRRVHSIQRVRKATASTTLLSGYDIMKIRNISEGPLIGSYLERLNDAQLSGKVSNKDEATRFIKRLK